MSSLSGLKFLTTAVRMAVTALSEGRLTASPARWLTDLRHLYGLMRESSARATPGPPSDAAVPLERDAFIAAAQQRLTSFLADGRTLDLTPPAHPAVSVLLVLHNRAELTLGCLESLVAQDGVRLEVVIVDNASTDDTGVLLDRLRGVETIRSPENLGFLHACNLAARAARGDSLLFLNNDTVVHTPEASRRRSTPSPATRRLAPSAAVWCFPTDDCRRRVQSSGTTVHAWAMGGGDSPWLAALCLRARRGLLLRRVPGDAAQPLHALGGFDPRYEPAYYEDADYCVRLWKAGARVVYDPRAVVTHVSSAAPHPLHAP